MTTSNIDVLDFPVFHGYESLGKSVLLALGFVDMGMVGWEAFATNDDRSLVIRVIELAELGPWGGEEIKSALRQTRLHFVTTIPFDELERRLKACCPNAAISRDSQFLVFVDNGYFPHPIWVRWSH